MCSSFGRHELRNHVINHVSFRDHMEVNPEVTPLLLEAGLCSQRHVLHGVLRLTDSFLARS